MFKCYLCIYELLANWNCLNIFECLTTSIVLWSAVQYFKNYQVDVKDQFISFVSCSRNGCFVDAAAVKTQFTARSWHFEARCLLHFEWNMRTNGVKLRCANNNNILYYKVERRARHSVCFLDVDLLLRYQFVSTYNMKRHWVNTWSFWIG